MSTPSLASAQAILADQLATLHAHTPSFVSSLSAEPEPGPAQWLLHSIGGCACGSCGEGGEGPTEAGGSSAALDGEAGSFSVECLMRGPSDDPCFGTTSYRLRITVGALTAGFGGSSRSASIDGESDGARGVAGPWPVLRFLDELHHLGVDASDGFLKPDLLDLLIENWADDAKQQPTLEALLTLVHTQVLVGVAPAALSDDSSSSPSSSSGLLSPVQHQWQQYASANRQRVETVAAFRDGLAPFPALVDPAAAPKCLAEFGPSPRWPAGIIDPSALQALQALASGDGGAALLGCGTSSQSQGDGTSSGGGVARWECPGVASLPLFTPSFCANVVATLEAYEASGLPTVRPNSMNNYGAVLARLGFAPLLRSLQHLVAAPLAACLDAHRWGRAPAATATEAAVASGASAFRAEVAEAATAAPPSLSPAPSSPLPTGPSALKLPPVTECAWLDGQHAFSVRYKAGEDLSLDLHTDDSEVTLNACLGKPGFEGSGLVFCGDLGAADHRVLKTRYQHAVGRCVVHKGSQRHGADEITGGERVNLIMWHRSLAFRRKKERAPMPYAAEGSLPSPECLSFTHDRDYLKHHPPGAVLPPAAALAAGRGWCPPPGKEFQPLPRMLLEQEPPPLPGRGDDSGDGGGDASKGSGDYSDFLF
jgi:hypothetical protein